MTSNRDPSLTSSWFEKPKGVAERLAAGGLVVRVGAAGDVYVSFAREKGFESSVLPKGRVKKKETAEQAARREIAEESGFSDLHLLADLGTLERMNFARTHWKITRYFLFATRQLEATPTDRKHPPSVWYPLRERPALYWPEQQALLDDNEARIRGLALAWHEGA